MPDVVRVGTRGSRLAVAQTQLILDELKRADPSFQFEIVTISTSGDHGFLAVVGAFVKEVEQALLDGKVDMAVHSLKDMPVDMEPGLALAATPVRGDHRDCLIADKKTLAQLSAGAVVGTGSLRRQYQLKMLRADVECREIRGNIITRMGKIGKEVDAVMLAAAGLYRVEEQHAIDEIFEVGQLVPAVAQGILAVQTRENDNGLIARLQPVHHRNTELAALAERAFLKATGGGCRHPYGAYAEVQGERIHITGFIARTDGSRMAKDHIVAPLADATAAGEGLAYQLLEKIA